MLILVTGAAGFVGFHTAQRLLAEGHTVVGLDSLNHYYDVRLKEARLERLREHAAFSFVRMQLQDRQGIADVFAARKFERVVHLAAQAGVAYSLDHPDAYVESNLVGFLNVLEGCRRASTPHLVYASSSSVYGGNTRMPFAETDSADHPLTLYGATKRANELMAHAYSHLFGLPTSGLRFFTVYGPWGRPDMVFFLFTRAILEGRPLDVYNFGAMQRDFTYVDDVVEAIVRVMDTIPERDPAGYGGDGAGAAPSPAESAAPYRVYNVGNHEPAQLMEVIALLEERLGKSASLNLLPMRAGDVPATFANADRLRAATGFAPATPLRDGIRRFVDWYLEFYGRGADAPVVAPAERELQASRGSA